MDGRLIAIGDIHGCAPALDRLLELIEPRPADTVVTLGDYVNRGPDSRGVLERLRRLATECQLVPLLGNHDQVLLSNRKARLSPGDAVRDPFTNQELFAQPHFQFLESCRLYFETDGFLFMHASYDHRREMADQEQHTLLWGRLRNRIPKRHRSGKTVVVGHSPQADGEILDCGHLICIDTFCHGGGWLTGLEMHTRKTWQVDRNGDVRSHASA